MTMTMTITMIMINTDDYYHNHGHMHEYYNEHIYNEKFTIPKTKTTNVRSSFQSRPSR